MQFSDLDRESSPAHYIWHEGRLFRYHCVQTPASAMHSLDAASLSARCSILTEGALLHFLQGKMATHNFTANAPAAFAFAPSPDDPTAPPLPFADGSTTWLVSLNTDKGEPGASLWGRFVIRDAPVHYIEWVRQQLSDAV